LKHSTSFSNILTGEKNSAPSGGEKINLFGGNSQVNTAANSQVRHNISFNKYADGRFFVWLSILKVRLKE